MPATILLVDDDPNILEDLPVYFTTTDEFEVVGTASNGAEALSWLTTHTCDVVLSDISMPDIDGIELLQHLQKLPTSPVFVAMTAFDTDETMLQILANGGAGYILKGQPPATIITAVRDALNGGTSLSPRCIARLVDMSVKSSPRFASPPQRQGHRPKTLTPGERDVLALINEGMSNAQIAEELSFSESSIKKKVSALLRKYGVKSRSELIVLSRGK